jgi:hypothetical protein
VTRHDVANLVIRIFALWLAVTGVATIASVPFLTTFPGFPALLFTASALFLPLPAGVALWYLAPRLAGAVFDRSGGTVPHAITPAIVPPLACFVVGLVVLAGAAPDAASWLIMQVMRSRLDASLANPNVLLPFDLRSAGTAAEVLARLIVGVVLIAISRRRDIWSTPELVASADESADTAER